MGTANTLTHSHTLTRACTSTHTAKIWGKGGEKGDSTGIHSIKLEITTLIENKKMEKKKKKKKRSCYRSTYIWHQNSLIINFKKCAKFTNNRFFLLRKRLWNLLTFALFVCCCCFYWHTETNKRQRTQLTVVTKNEEGISENLFVRCIRRPTDKQREVQQHFQPNMKHLK